MGRGQNGHRGAEAGQRRRGCLKGTEANARRKARARRAVVSFVRPACEQLLGTATDL